jgi:hypothetical protein
MYIPNYVWGGPNYWTERDLSGTGTKSCPVMVYGNRIGESLVYYWSVIAEGNGYSNHIFDLQHMFADRIMEEFVVHIFHA